MTLGEQLYNEGIQKGIESGVEKGQLDLAKRLIAAGVDPTLIAKASNMHMDTILAHEIYADTESEPA